MLGDLLLKFLLILVVTVPTVFLLYFIGKGWYALRKQPIPDFRRCFFVGALIVGAIGIPLAVLVPVFIR